MKDLFLFNLLVHLDRPNKKEPFLGAQIQTMQGYRVDMVAVQFSFLIEFRGYNWLIFWGMDFQGLCLSFLWDDFVCYSDLPWSFPHMYIHYNNRYWAFNWNNVKTFCFLLTTAIASTYIFTSILCLDQSKYQSHLYPHHYPCHHQ